MTAAGLRLYRPATAVDRRLARLVLLSLLLHGGLFLLMAGPRPVATPALPKLLATLQLPLIHVSGTPLPATLPVALPSKVRQSPVAAANRPVPRQPQAAGPATAPAPANAVATEAAAPAALPATLDVPVANAPPVVQPAAVSADLLAAYRRRLGELLAGQQDYPRVAALRGWEGEVRLRLRVARKGNLLAVALDRSSGFTVLDQHALALLADLGSLPPLPEGLGDNEIQVVVPITYKLNKTT